MTSLPERRIVDPSWFTPPEEARARVEADGHVVVYISAAVPESERKAVVMEALRALRRDGQIPVFLPLATGTVLALRGHAAHGALAAAAVAGGAGLATAVMLAPAHPGELVTRVPVPARVTHPHPQQRWREAASARTPRHHGHASRAVVVSRPGPAASASSPPVASAPRPGPRPSAAAALPLPAPLPQVTIPVTVPPRPVLLPVPAVTQLVPAVQHLLCPVNLAGVKVCVKV